MSKRELRQGAVMGGAHRSKGNDEWITPKHIIDSVGISDLDPCSAIGQPWRTAGTQWTIEDDGLSRQWFGSVWLNPPYGSATGRWLERLRDHGNGIALIFARTETKMFVEGAWGGADSMLFLHGRLWFHHKDGSRAKANSGAPSVLLGYGSDATERLKLSGLAGSLVSDWEQSEVRK